MTKTDISTKHINLNLEKKDSKTIPKQVYCHILYYEQLYYTPLPCILIIYDYKAIKYRVNNMIQITMFQYF